jgi:hypothetical protein
MLSDLPGMQLTGIPAGIHPNLRKLQDGRTFRVLDNIQIEPGKRLSFGLKNLPQPSSWSIRLRWLAGITVLALFGWVLVSTIGRRRLHVPAQANHLLALRRGQLLDELVRLETRQRKGKVPEEEYRERRGRLMRELEQIFSELGEGRK